MDKISCPNISLACSTSTMKTIIMVLSKLLLDKSVSEKRQRKKRKRGNEPFRLLTFSSNRGLKCSAISPFFLNKLIWKRFPFFSGVAYINSVLPGARPSPLSPVSNGTGCILKILTSTNIQKSKNINTCFFLVMAIFLIVILQL